MRQQKIWSFRDLDVYKLAYKTSLDLHRLTMGFPKIEQYGGLADQIRRSSKSICANLAEGFAKKKMPKEFVRYIAIALGSSDETQVWLEYCKDLEYITVEQHHSFIESYSSISKMLMGLRASWKDKS